MNRFTPAICTSLLVTLYACATPEKTEVASSEPVAKVINQTSPDGHRFNYHHMPEASRTAVAIAWFGGFAQLPAGKENISYFGPRLMTDGGADGRPASDIRAEFESLDAGSQLYSEDDSIRGFVVAPTDEFASAATIANQVLHKPDLDDNWLSRFKQELRTNKITESQTVEGQAWNTLRGLLVNDARLLQAWSWTPLNNIDSISREDVIQWHRESLSTNDTTIAVAGNINLERAGEIIDRTFSGLPQQHNRQNFPPLKLNFTGSTVLIHKPDADKSFLLLAGPMPTRDGPDELALALGVGVLGQSSESRLFKTVRGEQRAAYRFGANKYSFTRKQEVLSISGEVETAKLATVLSAVGNSYNTFVQEGIGVIEFPVAHRIMLQRIRENTEKPATVAYLITEVALQNRSLDDALTVYQRASSLERVSVNNAIRNHFPAFADLTKVIVSPDKTAVTADCVINDFSELHLCTP